MIHIIVGSTGAGKTTYARKFQKQEGGILFSIDQWNKTLYWADLPEKETLPWLLERIEREETLMMDLILQLEEQGVDAILDLGFSKGSHRKKFIDFAMDSDLLYQIHFLDFDVKERKARVDKRNNDKTDTFEFVVTDDDFDFMETYFEPPSRLELKDATIITS